MKLQRMLSNGVWTDESRTEMFLDMVIEFDGPYAIRQDRQPLSTREQVIEFLATGKTALYDCDWYAMIRDADAIKPITRKPVEMYRCDCGHTVPASHVMSSSRGTSCSDCYDRMSE
jgi:hypothetical protein